MSRHGRQKLLQKKGNIFILIDKARPQNLTPVQQANVIKGRTNKQKPCIK